MKTYKPMPIQTGGIQLSPALENLTELLAKNTHDMWARQRIHEGWKFGEKRNDETKEHPDLIPYEQLSEKEKEYDRITAMETIKAILELGYKITEPEEEQFFK